MRSEKLGDHKHVFSGTELNVKNFAEYCLWYLKYMKYEI